MHRWNIHRQF